MSFICSDFAFSRPFLWTKRTFHVVSYGTRPLWDAAFKQEINRWKIIKNYHLSSYDKQASCQLHNFTLRQLPVKVFDVFLFSSEVDLLEVRLRELNSTVDKFVIIEGDCYFNGQPKTVLFSHIKNGKEFAPFLNKIHHHIITGICSASEKGFSAEALHRTKSVEIARHAGATDGDLFLFGDLDELPRHQTLELLSACDFGERIHLQLWTFRYSFEFPLYPEFVFRSTVSVLGRLPDSSISHRFTYITDRLLADAGWHCTWCLKTMDLVRQKMIGYSHSDRIHSENLLKDEVIQEKMCNGGDIFDFLPEADTFETMFRQLNIVPAVGVSQVPQWIVDNPTRFSYLLPGGCKRTLR